MDNARDKLASLNATLHNEKSVNRNASSHSSLLLSSHLFQNSFERYNGDSSARARIELLRQRMNGVRVLIAT